MLKFSMGCFHFHASPQCRSHWNWYRFSGGPLENEAGDILADFIVGRGFSTPLFYGQMAWYLVDRCQALHRHIAQRTGEQ